MGLFRVTPSAVPKKKNDVRNSKLGIVIYSIFKDMDSSNIHFSETICFEMPFFVGNSSTYRHFSTLEVFF